MPTVSVILPTFNRAHCIRRAVNSVLDQTFTDFELIVIDDGSRDATREIIGAYDDPRLRYIHHEDNLGQTIRLNEGISLARAELIAFQDSDDEWLPEKLEKQVAAFRNAPADLGVVYVDKWRHEPGRAKFHWRSPHNTLDDGLIYMRALDDGVQNIGPQSVLIRKSCFDRVGYFDERIRRSNDLELFIRISRYYLFHHIPEPLVNYYVSGDTMTNTLGEAKAIAAVEIILEKHWSAFERNPRVLAKRAYWVGSFHMRHGDRLKGWRYLNLALRHHPKPRYLAAVTAALFGQPAYRAFHRIASRPNHLALEGS